MAKAKKTNGDLNFEAKLWQAADKMRNNMDADEYKHVVLGLIFLKYISDAFNELYRRLSSTKGADPEDADEYRAENVFYVPKKARWEFLQKNAKQPTIGKLIDDAMDEIEKDNTGPKGVLPIAMGSYTGSKIWEDIVGRRKRPEGNRLHEMVFKEFETKPSGLILPDNKVLKRFDGKRVWRVVWKITRGLFFKEYGRFLPDGTPRVNKIYSEGQRPNSEFDYIGNTPSKGQYPAVFDYKYIVIPELNKFHFWGMLFWDKLIMQIGFHDPECFCKKCKTNAAN